MCRRGARLAEKAGDAHAGAMSEELKRTLEQVGRECFCLRSRMAARAVTRRYNALLSRLGLEVTEFSLLGALAVGKASSIAELAERLAFERTTLVRNLKRMADRGLIEATGNKGRAIRYILTKHGDRLLKRALPLWAEAQASVKRRLEPEDSRTVLNSLESLRSATQERD